MSNPRTELEARLAAMVARVQDRLHELRADFETAWRRRDAVSALYAFQCYREALKRHLAVEEAPRSLRRHTRQHGLIQNLCVDVLELLARRIWMGGCVDGEIAGSLTVLDRLIARHEACELVELKAGLGHVTDEDLVRLEKTIVDPRMLRASAC